MLNSVGIAHLGLRIVVSFGLQNILSFLSNLDKVGQIPGIDGHYDTEDYSVVFHLVSHTETMIAEELYQYALVCFIFLLLQVWMKELTNIFFLVDCLLSDTPSRTTYQVL